MSSTNLPPKKNFKYLFEQEEIEQDEEDKECIITIKDVPKARRTIKINSFTKTKDTLEKTQSGIWTFCIIS
tara:strand:- start:152 stop:364 length:213 start_codon:yes stop_codon:yes gene_type:complete